MDQEKPKPYRLYQVWKGSNKFLCGGRLIFGPDVASLFLSTFLVGGPAIAFCIKVLLVIRSGSKEHKDAIHWYSVLTVGIILTVLDMLLLFLTSSRDPGIISRNTTPPESEETDEISTPSMEWVNGRTPHMKLPRTKDVVVNGHTVKMKYCDTCLLYRPPRASHCSICNNCVQRFDHHCPWLGQCVGMRTYRLFYMFVSTSTILCVYVFVVSLVHVIHQEGNKWKAMLGDILSTLLVLYCFIAFWFVGGLTVFHFYLISTNQTTYENFRYRYDRKENPYNRGAIKNLKEVFFAKIPPPIDFRAYVMEDEVMIAEAMDHGSTDNSREKVDIEMGDKFAGENGASFPEMSQNMEPEGENERYDSSPFLFSAEQEFKDPEIISPIEDEGNADEKHDEATSDPITACVQPSNICSFY